MDIFENLENLNVSEECFDEIVTLIEAIMDDIKAGMDPEKAKKKWVADKNNEYVDAVNKETQAHRLLNKAEKKFLNWVKGKTDRTVGADTTIDLRNKARKATQLAGTKFLTQLKANYMQGGAGKGKMVLPTHSQDGGYTHRSGFEKGGKKYTPKKK